MNRKLLFILIITGLMLIACSCALIHKPIDEQFGFSKTIKQTEDSIKSQDWEKAESNLDESIKKWEKLKPLLQIDIDHDYVNSIEEDFVKLKAYIETREKADSLAAIRLIDNAWENIGSL